MTKLNLGCGRDIREGWVNVDYEARPGVDLVLNLENGPLPFDDASVDEVLASHILEHLFHWESLVFEIHRILKPGGKFEVKVPAGVRGFGSAYHVRFFSIYTMEDFSYDPEKVIPASFQPRPLFKKLLGHKHYRFPLRWHLKHYLGMDLYHLPFGEADEIHWILEKRA